MDGEGGDGGGGGGGGGGLAPLAATVEETAWVAGGEESGLDGVGVEVEPIPGEADRVGSEKEIGNHGSRAKSRIEGSRKKAKVEVSD
ncbi:MAG: hypothetical protein ACKV22_29845 [Bryobacteraceae bacterium]